MTRRIFLSYARDDEPFVEKLYHALRRRGFDVWWDRTNMPSRGLTFNLEIRDAVAGRERLLLVLGPAAVRSEYVRQEWQFAFEWADRSVTPILRFGDYSLVPDELRRLHCEDFRDDDLLEFHLENLARQLAEEPAPLAPLLGNVPELPVHFQPRADRVAAIVETCVPTSTGRW